MPILEYSQVEQMLADAIRAGRKADFNDASGLKQKIFAVHLKQSILKTPKNECQSRIQIENAIIIGSLDFSGCEIHHSLAFYNCTFGSAVYKGIIAPILLRDSTLQLVLLRKCKVYGRIVADRASFSYGFDIRETTVQNTERMEAGVTLKECQSQGHIDLRGSTFKNEKEFSFKGRKLSRKGIGIERSKIDGHLLLDDITIIADLGINADGAEVGGMLSACRSNVHGGIRVSRSTIRGGFRALGISIQAKQHAINAAGANIERGVNIATWKHERQTIDTNISGCVVLAGAAIGGGVNASDAVIKAPKVELENDRDALAINAEFARITGSFNLSRSRIEGQLRLLGARITGALSANDARFLNLPRSGEVVDASSAPGLNQCLALNAEDSVIRGDVFMRRAKVCGELRLLRAKVGSISLNKARLRNRWNGVDRLAIQAERMRAGRWESFGIVVFGHASFLNSRINGKVALAGGRYRSFSGAALIMDGVRVRGDVGLSLAKISGSLRIAGSEISGSLVARGVELDRPKSVGTSGFSAIRSSRTVVRKDIIFEENSRGNKCPRIMGALDFSDCKIGGSFRFHDAELVNRGSTALNLARSRAKSNCSIRADIEGRIVLTGATIKQTLQFRESTLAGGGEIACAAFGMEVGGIIFEHTVAYGAVVLNRTRALSSIRLQSTKFNSMDTCPQQAGLVQSENVANQERHRAVALSLVETTCNHLELIGDNPDDYPKGLIDLREAETRTLEDNLKFWGVKRKSLRAQFAIHGFKYERLALPAGVSEIAVRTSGAEQQIYVGRKLWLVAASKSVAHGTLDPQPWLQLCDYLNNNGHKVSAEKIFISWRTRYDKEIGGFQKLQGLFLNACSGYGYRPWRSVWASIIVVFLFSAFWWGVTQDCIDRNGIQDCSSGMILQPSAIDDFIHHSIKKEEIKEIYPRFHPVLYSVDIFLPLSDLGYQAVWKPNSLARPQMWLPTWQYTLTYLSELIDYRIDKDHHSMCTSERYTPIALPGGGHLLWFMYWLEAVLGVVFVALMIAGFSGLLRRQT